MNVLKILQGLAKLVAPPSHNAHHKEVHRWRWTLSGFVLVYALHVIWSTGAFSFIAWLPRPAFADDVQIVADDVDRRLAALERPLRRLLASDIRDDILHELRRLCRSEDPDDRDDMRERIEELQEEYRGVKGRDYSLPRCEDL